MKFILKAFMLAISISVPAISYASTDSKVYLNYSQKELNDQYNQLVWAPNQDQILDRYQERSNYAIKELGMPLVYKYGNKEIEKFRLFKTEMNKAPLVIFIHGGAWRGGYAHNYDFPANVFVNNNINYIALDFSTVQEVGLDGMSNQIRNAIAYIYNSNIDFDRQKIYLIGHSSGAHLGGVILYSDWKKNGLPSDLIKGATLLSGIYNLLPASKSSRSSYVPFTKSIIKNYSPINFAEKIKMPLILSYGGLESDEFKKQTIEFYNKVKDYNPNTSIIFQQKFNHFEVMDDFSNPYNQAVNETLKMINK